MAICNPVLDPTNPVIEVCGGLNFLGCELGSNRLQAAYDNSDSTTRMVRARPTQYLGLAPAELDVYSHWAGYVAGVYQVNLPFVDAHPQNKRAMIHHLHACTNSVPVGGADCINPSHWRYHRLDERLDLEYLDCSESCWCTEFVPCSQLSCGKDENGDGTWRCYPCAPNPWGNATDPIDNLQRSI